MSEITIRRGDQQFGPYQIDDVERYYREGRLLPSDMAWREGDPDWKPLASLVGPSVEAPPAPFGHAPAYAPPVPSAPSAPTSRYPKASFGKRVVALLIDWAIGMLVPVLVSAVLGVGSFGGNTGIHFTGIVAFAAWIAAFWYGFAKDGFEGGAGYGKRAVGLMVVHLSDNRPCTMGRSAIRHLITMVLGFTGIGLLIELILAIADDGGRRLADKAADTQVILASDYRTP